MTQITAREMRVDGRPARVWRGGSGPSLVLLHGGLGDAELHWSPVWEALAASFSLAAPDLPGFGGTAPLPQPSFENYAAWVGLLFERLGIPRGVLAGNSFGAAVARIFATTNPARVTRMILIDGGRILRPPAIARWLMGLPLLSDLLFSFIRRSTCSDSGMRRFIHNPTLLTPEFKTSVRAAALGFTTAMRKAALVPVPTALLAPPPAPTLVVWGEADRLSPPKFAHALVNELPGAVLELIPEAGHLPQIEQPERVVASIRRFALTRQ